VGRLIHKFQNIRQEIELVQQLEISRFEMAYRNYGTIWKR